MEYRWHPLFGHELLVKGTRHHLGALVLRCHVPGDERRDCLHIPSWMFDKALCASLRLHEEPYAGLEALEELRSLLDAVIGSGSAIHNRRTPPVRFKEVVA